MCLQEPVPPSAQVPESAPLALSHSWPAGTWGLACPTRAPGQTSLVDIPQGRLLLNDVPAFLQGCCQALPHREAPTGQLDAWLEEASPGQPPVALVCQLIATDLTWNCHRQSPYKARRTQLMVPKRDIRASLRHHPQHSPHMGPVRLRKEMDFRGRIWTRQARLQTSRGCLTGHRMAKWERVCRVLLSQA